MNKALKLDMAGKHVVMQFDLGEIDIHSFPQQNYYEDKKIETAGKNFDY